MKQYVVIDENHQHVRHGECASRDLPLQAGLVHKDSEGHRIWEPMAGLSVIEGAFDERTEKIEAGRIVKKTRQELEADVARERQPVDPPRLVTQQEWDALIKRLALLEGQG